MSKRNLFTRIATLVMALAMLLAISSTALAQTANTSGAKTSEITTANRDTMLNLDVGTANDSVGFQYILTPQFTTTSFQGSYVFATKFTEFLADTTSIGAAANGVSASLTPQQFADLAPDKNYGTQTTTADYKTNYDGKAETLSKIVDAFAKYCIAKHATDASAYQTLKAGADGKLRIGEMASYGICFGIGENSARIYQTTVFNSMPFAGTGNDAGKWLIYSAYDLVMKSALPKVEKSVAGAGADKDAYVGQELTYTINATVPVYKDFKPDDVDTNNPVLQIQDTLSTSLTMLSKASEVAVTDGTDALPNGSYTVTIDGKVLTVRFNYDDAKVRAASEVYVTYKAKINEYAVVGTAGNPNTVTYKYSNSPSVTSDWKNDPPTTGIGTQTDTEIVYTYGLQILKHEKDHTDIALNNAEFKIYTTAACDGDSVGTFRTDSKGVGVYIGLPKGTYWIKESVPPVGYSLNPNAYPVDLLNPTSSVRTTTTLKFTTEATQAMPGVTTQAISAATGLPLWMTADDLTGASIEASATQPAGKVPAYLADKIYTKVETGGAVGDGYAEIINVPDDKTPTLPETGGVGTTLFYVFGSLLVIGAGVLLVTKKRMSKNEK